MDNAATSLIQTTVTNWATRTFATDEVVLGQIALDDQEDRYLVDVAARPVGYWLLVEVWLEDGRVVAMNDLGEGLPLVNSEWPWPEDGD
jgi:hypothetical protein